MFVEIPHTADVALYVESTTYKGLFYDAAIGLINISNINVSSQKNIYHLEYKDKTFDKETLLVNWLNFLINQLDKNLCLINCNILIYKNSIISNSYFKKYEKRTLLVKSATFHDLKIVKSNKIIYTQIVFDV